MTERTTTQTMLGCTVAISASRPATYDAAGYGATGMTYTTIGQVETPGEVGVKATVAEFTPVATGVVTKRKGSKNYGAMPLLIGSLPSDAGQALLKSASDSQNSHSIKLTYPLGEGESTGEIHYMEALVSDFVELNGDANAIRKVSALLHINRAPVIVDAT